MTPDEIRARFPYPVASAYADLDDPAASLQLKQEALYFTVYQLMRTVALPLVGQYLGKDALPDGPGVVVAGKKLNEAIQRIRSPYYSDWIGLLHALAKHGPILELDLFPDFGTAMAVVKASRVAIPHEYSVPPEHRCEGLNWLDAFLALRNHSNHSGSSRDEACHEDLVRFRPFLDELLGAFAFLADCELLVHESTDADDTLTLRSMRGANPDTLLRIDPLADETLALALMDSPVVIRTAGGRVHGLFPLFHGHLEGEPLRYYDGHYLRDDAIMVRRTIFYLGGVKRLPLDDAEAGGQVVPPADPCAGERLRELLDRRAIPWLIRRTDLAPWTIRDTVCDYTTRTVADMLGTKYLPQTYLDRPELSGPLLALVRGDQASTPRRAMLLTGLAGTGKSAVLCDVARRLLEGESEDDTAAAPSRGAREDLVYFVRGDSMVREVAAGGNRLLGDFLHKIGLEPGDLPTFASFFSALKAKRKEDRVEGRRFVILLDGLNETRDPRQVFEEAIELVRVARQYPWVRLVIAVREEFLAIWRGRIQETEADLFTEAVRACFVEPPSDPDRPRKPEDLPAWPVPAFHEDEAETVYRRYQEKAALGEIRPVCLTPWERVPPSTRQTLLLRPLHLQLWMEAFAGEEAPPVQDESALFDRYLDESFRRFPRLREGLAELLDLLLERGLTELGDAEDRDLRERWEARTTERERRLGDTPVEVAVAAGLLVKRASEDGSGYRIPYQRLREQLLFRRLQDRDPNVTPASLREWLGFPETPDLEGALVQVALWLWEKGRARELGGLFGRGNMAGQVLERCIASIAARYDGDLESCRGGLADLAAALPEGEDLHHWFAKCLLFDVLDRVPGMVITVRARVLVDTARGILEGLAERHDAAGEPVPDRLLRNLSVSYNQLGDFHRALGDGEQALAFFQKALDTAEDLRRRNPNSADFARDLSVSYERLGDFHRALGDGEQALDFFQKALDIAEDLRRRNPNSADFARDLSVSYERLGDFHRALGDGEQALDFYRKSLEIREDLRRRNPQSADFARDLAVSHFKLGQLFLQQGNEESGVRHLHACFTELSGMEARGQMLDEPMRGLLENLRKTFAGGEDNPTG